MPPGAMAAAPVKSCQFVVLRSPGGRSGSGLYTCNRLQRMRGRFHRWIHVRTGAQLPTGLHHDPPKFSIQSSLGSTKHRRMLSRGPPDPRPIPEGVREPIYPRKKCTIWARWRPVPVSVSVGVGRCLSGATRVCSWAATLKYLVAVDDYGEL